MSASSDTDRSRGTLERSLLAMSPKSKWAKQYRKTELERLLCESILERDRWLGSVELGKLLNVTPRTVRTYLKERRELLSGPAKIWLHLHDKDGKPVGVPELLTIEECAEHVGVSVREIRRKIWEQRRDWIAEVREQFKEDRKTAKESKQDATQDKQGKGLS
jgi:hypothetical protein